MANFHEQLKKKRKERQVTQEQIAEHLNVARQTVSKWESGKSIPDIENAQQLATFLDIGLNELLGNENDLEETRNINKKNRIKKYLSILSIVITFIIVIFLSNFYLAYYSNPDKEITLYNVYDLSYKNENGVILNTTDNKQIKIRSYFDIIKYSIQNHKPENSRKTRVYTTSKNEIERILKEDKEYSQKK